MLQSWDEHRENHDALLRYLDLMASPEAAAPEQCAAQPDDAGTRLGATWPTARPARSSSWHQRLRELPDNGLLVRLGHLFRGLV
jgi:hypothetical protein